MEKTVVMQEFENICTVPRSSFHNEKIIRYCIDWAKENGFAWEYDDVNDNVIITREAAPGMEDKPGIVIQGHLDMVAECEPGVEHDFLNEGIDFYIDGDFYKAHGTTLGADNGVAPAIGFALFKDKSLKNPHLELLLTTDEEVGMLSVKNADLTGLKGKYMLNLDSGPEGEFTVGCCGGKLLKALVADNRESGSGNFFRVSIGGLEGGHSGIEITSEKANAIKILGEYIYRLSLDHQVRIADAKAVGKDNAISNNAECVFATDATAEEIKAFTESFEKDYKHIFRITDKGLWVKCEKAENQDVLCEKESNALAFLLHNLPYGVQNFEQTLDTVESSVNLGIIENDGANYGIYVSIRSSVAERITEIAGKARSLCAICGADCVDEEKSYPAWLADYESPFLKHSMKMYKELTGKEPKVSTTHGGLECGFIMANSNIESIVAIGPTSFGEHTPTEKLSISSLNNTFEFAKKIIENI